MDPNQGQELATRPVLTFYHAVSPSIGPARSHLRFEFGGEIGSVGEKEEMSYGT